MLQDRYETLAGGDSALGFAVDMLLGVQIGQFSRSKQEPALQVGCCEGGLEKRFV